MHVYPEEIFIPAFNNTAVCFFFAVKKQSIENGVHCSYNVLLPKVTREISEISYPANNFFAVNELVFSR